MSLKLNTQQKSRLVNLEAALDARLFKREEERGSGHYAAAAGIGAGAAAAGYGAYRYRGEIGAAAGRAHGWVSELLRPAGAPVHNPAAAAPVHNPAGATPVHNPAGAMPVHNPVGAGGARKVVKRLVHR